MRGAEFAAFVLVSGALHAAVLGFAPLPGGGAQGTADRQSTVTLRSAAGSLAALSATWDTPPQTSNAPVLRTPAANIPLPKRPDTEARSQRPGHQSAELPPPPPPPPVARPMADTRLPAPPVPFAAPTPNAPHAPTVPTAPVLVPSSQMARLDRPVLPQMAAQRPMPPAPNRQIAPKPDTEPAAPRIAPTASARPQTRPPRAPDAPPQRAQAPSSPATNAAAGPARSRPTAPGPSQAKIAELEHIWGAQVSAALQRALRPPSGVYGSVALVIIVTPSGEMRQVEITGVTGNARLKNAAFRAAKEARLPKAPEGLTKSQYRFGQRLTVTR